MAYCLRSFVETLDQVLNPHLHYKKWVLDHDHRPQIQSLFENATSLQEFLDNSSPQIQQIISSLEDRIMDAAQKGSDALDSYITSQILLNPHDQSFTIFPPDLGEVLRVFEDAKQETDKIKGVNQLSYYTVPPSTPYPNSRNLVVGVEEDLNQLRSRLTSDQAELDVIPIVGMGGIGKTTLARILYDQYSSSRSRFDRCAWVTVSQSYDPQLVLKTILACVTGKPLNEMSQKETSDLTTTLYRALVGMRYLIVLDDIWSYKAWDDVRKALARDNQGSRVIFTTRENSLADCVKSDRHEMHFINKGDSWKLLRGIVFGDESCLPELKEIGKIIALKCGGLPLALQVIGGLLAHSQRSKEFWKYVERNISSFIDEQFAGIFCLSFSHLPYYLKPCFLYMGAFPQNYEIPASRLIKLWVAEGFMCPIPDKSLEEAAEMHLNALVNRNLISVRKRKNGKTKSYGIHDLLRDMCLKKAQVNKFLYVKDFKSDIYQEYDISCFCRVSFHLASAYVDYDFRSLKLTSLARSFILTTIEGSKRSPFDLCYKSSLLRVFDVLTSANYQYLEEFLDLVNLRYLATNNRCISSARGISVLKNLQTLIIITLESLAILENLPQLRNLKFWNLRKTHSLEIYPHDNLQSLSRVTLYNLSYLLGKIPNLRKLRIVLDSYDSVVDLTCFQKLESLRFSSNDLTMSTLYTMSSNVIFPQSLKRLKFYNCEISRILEAVGVLPGLEVLKLQVCAFENSSWEPTEREFRKLQYLEINGSNLENWSASEIHFPVLRHLILKDCKDLSEIPNGIGEIETLEIIELDKCKASVFDSARTIVEEQLEYGNTLLQLRLGRTSKY